MISIRYPWHRWWEYSKVSARSGQFDQIPNSQNRFSRKSLAAREENLPLDHRRQRVNHTRRCNTVMKTLAFSHPIGSQSNTVVEKERPSGIPTAVVGVKFPSGLHAVQSFDQGLFIQIFFLSFLHENQTRLWFSFIYNVRCHKSQKLRVFSISLSFHNLMLR